MCVGGTLGRGRPGAHLAHSLSSDATRMLCGSREPLWSHRVGVRYGREGCPGNGTRVTEALETPRQRGIQ